MLKTYMKAQKHASFHVFLHLVPAFTPHYIVMVKGLLHFRVHSVQSDLMNIRQTSVSLFTPKLLVPDQVRQRNVLKDFVQVAGPLGVTHFIIISKTEEFINLRICRLPRGPTVTFHVKAVSLAEEE